MREVRLGSEADLRAPQAVVRFVPVTDVSVCQLTHKPALLPTPEMFSPNCEPAYLSLGENRTFT